MFKCEFCGKEYQDKIPFSNHLSHCPKNLNRTIQKNFRQKNIIEPLIDDNGKLYSKYLNKRNNAKKENIDFFLTYLEFCKLVLNANIKSSDLGFSGNNYVLARFNDSGPYSFDNCRFITQLENARERKVSDLVRLKSSNNFKKYNEYLKQHPDVLIKKNKRSAATRKLNKKLGDKKPKKVDTKNSQFGTYWITNGEINKKWKDEKGPIPETFYRGRIV